jgi:hypothetical protein
MSTTSTPPGNIPTPTPDQISQTTTAALASADTGSADTILNLKMAHNARLSQLKRTADTLKKQLGPDDPSVSKQPKQPSGSALPKSRASPSSIRNSIRPHHRSPQTDGLFTAASIVQI